MSKTIMQFAMDGYGNNSLLEDIQVILQLGKMTMCSQIVCNILQIGLSPLIQFGLRICINFV